MVCDAALDLSEAGFCAVGLGGWHVADDLAAVECDPGLGISSLAIISKWKRRGLRTQRIMLKKETRQLKVV